MRCAFPRRALLAEMSVDAILLLVVVGLLLAHSLNPASSGPPQGLTLAGGTEWALPLLL